MCKQSFNDRVNLNGVDYDVEGHNSNGTVQLRDTLTRQPRTITQTELRVIKQQNEDALNAMYGEILREP